MGELCQYSGTYFNNSLISFLNRRYNWGLGTGLRPFLFLGFIIRLCLNLLGGCYTPQTQNDG
ncbi:hypothetical protein NSP_21960 [Nodularia spumigena CCY9414]|nr:hypothetical protein NSP_21960 [Nodularia spumigena CCY9414]